MSNFPGAVLIPDTFHAETRILHFMALRSSAKVPACTMAGEEPMGSRGLGLELLLPPLMQAAAMRWIAALLLFAIFARASFVRCNSPHSGWCVARFAAKGARIAARKCVPLATLKTGVRGVRCTGGSAEFATRGGVRSSLHRGGGASPRSPMSIALETVLGARSSLLGGVRGVRCTGDRGLGDLVSGGLSCPVLALIFSGLQPRSCGFCCSICSVSVPASVRAAPRPPAILAAATSISALSSASFSALDPVRSCMLSSCWWECGLFNFILTEGFLAVSPPAPSIQMATAEAAGPCPEGAAFESRTPRCP